MKNIYKESDFKWKNLNIKMRGRRREKTQTHIEYECERIPLHFWACV